MKKYITLCIAFIFIALSYTRCFSKHQLQQDSIKIKFDLLNSTAADTVILEVFTHRWNNDGKIRYKSKKNDEGFFSFDIAVQNKVGYWQAYIYNNSNKEGSSIDAVRGISIPFVWESGDEILCEIENTPTKFGVESNYVFKGKGINKYILQAEMESSSLVEIYQDELSKPLIQFDQDFSFVAELDGLTKKRLKLLSLKKEVLSSMAYDILKSDILYKYGYGFYLSATKFFYNRFAKKSSDEKRIAISNFQKTIFSENDTLFNTDGFQKSLNGIEYLYYRYKIIVDLSYPNKDPLNIYNYIKDNSNDKLRENLLTYFVKQTILPEKIDSIINDAKPYFTSNEGKIEYEKLEKLLTGVKLASNTYQLFDINNEPFELTLSDFKNKVVFVDFYYTGCGPCRHLYQNTISKVKKRFENNDNVLFIAISIDRNYGFWLKSVQMNQYTSISSNTLNLFAGNSGIKNPLFVENNINRFPMTALFKDDKMVHYNTRNLFSEATLIQTIEELL